MTDHLPDSSCSWNRTPRVSLSRTQKGDAKTYLISHLIEHALRGLKPCHDRHMLRARVHPANLKAGTVHVFDLKISNQ